MIRPTSPDGQFGASGDVARAVGQMTELELVSNMRALDLAAELGPRELMSHAEVVDVPVGLCLRPPPLSVRTAWMLMRKARMRSR